ncbi:putative cobalamin B12-binding domain-containing protein [Magnetofaba australis IT-1]|uniref:Putative cobalamin B12-binding domain-containing protein n=1 Tax=Magnetofaba australis IT-1 TaxID=1434232 RepID=A0A1Y2K2D3_9PROT|nr:putative cobalamin B12-binding domain-containing protein [Magnetofaba australis IT-1]
MGAYALKKFPHDVEVRLFKRPELMIAAIQAERPDVVGLSHYVWNAQLDKLVYQIAKAANPQCLTVGGGPNFTDINANETHAKRFFQRQQACDVFVLNQGEAGFAALLERWLGLGCDLAALRRDPLEGALINASGDGQAVHVRGGLPAFMDLDEIPSPYLTGMLDDFFAETMTPIIETNRSCPYRCTFCAWGIGAGKLSQYSLERVFAEIDYIAAHRPKSMNLFLGDANFSILPRDTQIAERLRAAHDAHGYPGFCSIQWNKGAPQRVIETAKALKGLADITATLQSSNEKTLAAIKRKNLSLETIGDVVKTLEREGVSSIVFSELILGLPEETRESHLAAIRDLMDAGVEVTNYNLYLLEGTEMESPEQRAQYFKQTGWRLQDGGYGEYAGQRVVEGQEIVLETASMSREALRAFRFTHFLIQFLWSKRYYFDVLKLLQVHGVHPLDAILAIDAAMRGAEGDLGGVMADFNRDHDLENFATMQALAEYWTADEPFDRLRRGDYGKLNYAFSQRILLDAFEPFNALVQEVGQALLRHIAAPAEALEQLAEAIRFGAALRVRLTDALEWVEQCDFESRYDFLSWRKAGFEGAPAKMNGTPFVYHFQLQPEQKSNLQRQLNQFRAQNPRMTLRKMGEYISAQEFFYRC